MITDRVEVGDYHQLDAFFWSGTRERWNDATEEQKEVVFERLEDLGNDFESGIETNNIVWFDCYDMLFPEEGEEEDEEYEEDDVEESLVRRVCRLEKKISSDNKKSCQLEKKLRKTR